MKKSIFLIFIMTATALVAVISGCNSLSRAPRPALLQNEKQIQEIIGKMTLEEKVEMLHAKYMFVSAGVERLGIADMIYVDGPFGIREEMQPNGWAPLGWENDKATFFPTGSALAATWSPGLAYDYGTAMAREARLRGKDMLLGPAINIQRIPTGGRTYEYLSEDPFLSAHLSVGYTKGVQDNGVAACLKHYALNNQENNRGTVNVIIGERAMREIYLPPFQAAVTEGGAYGVMAAYNKVNGWWCAENDILLNKILRDDWGFAGMVISDWNGTHSTVNAIKNGLNVEMPTKRFLGDALIDSVKAGLVSEELVNQRVREILRVRMAIDPIPPEKANLEVTSQPPQQKIAYEVASKSIVLLENDGILPLDLAAKPVIAVIGANAEQKMSQGGLGAGVKTLYEVTPLEGLKNKIGDKAEIIYAKGYESTASGFGSMFRRRTAEEREKEAREKEEKAKILMQEAVEVASKAGVVLFIGGNNRTVETEGSDRRDIMLPAGQDQLISEIARVNPNIVTVLVSGAPNDLTVVKPLSRALLISWFNGTEGGNALADVLTGNISPGGRLPFTLPLKLEDSPAYALGNYPQGTRGSDVFANLVAQTEKTEKPEEKQIEKDLKNDPNTAIYSEESLIGYRWFDTKKLPVMYPFGYGLTYSEFEYANLKTDREKYGQNDVIKLSLELKNSGPVTADEVVQAYVHRINPSVEWPYKELKAFSRETLAPGEIRQVTLEIPVKSLQYWDEKLQSWNDDLCNIELQVGASAGNVLVKKEVTLK
ncbi:MAG TPA: glycoside hydrolase family 3 C-terminal domain-containing protein [Prolixibacteraceae bacterium]|mgnify:CR=1 FL=1|nr:glycoside hydrolase family 3 C-terminal domain-containing protein [Prolixibacteraceae bacterium]HOS00725.1 glycoside hydrolase family 3 C-terminal domain-containing protein [Prolixibacteraceae bacterium]HOS90361.1 glycoside hydrolase family 3 C-terminal domain-containing protein [Prolixibacteraceae bacterium]HPL44878.1 glycoside hydrolase family 3 C-terminal domain-containing protein [Prolixibacteraceae bacterium]HQE52482.1 glycoside hydrolase family 3 C-terminal domain-containing protein [P